MSAVEVDHARWLAQWKELSGLLRELDYYRDTIRTDEADEGLRFVVNLTRDRTQIVVLRRGALNGAPTSWVLVEAPFARLGEVDTTAVLAAIEHFPVGAIGHLDSLMTIRDSFELEAPSSEYMEQIGAMLGHIAETADAFEEHFLGKDAL